MRSRNFMLFSQTYTDTFPDEYFLVTANEENIQATDITVNGATSYGPGLDPYGNINVCGTLAKTVRAGSVEILFSKSSAIAETTSSVTDIVIISARG
jgi:hypothetical protein